MEISVLNLSSVNAYLLKSESGFILVDTGPANQRASLEHQLASAGCQPGNLNLILATHGDSDHVGNCAWLRQKYAAKIALHHLELEAVQAGDATLSKKIPGGLAGVLFGFIIQRFMLAPDDRFTPDLFLEDGDLLADYGAEAQVLRTPGHSNGSLSVLAANGDLICGDLLAHWGRPAPGMGIFDQAEFVATLAKLKRLNVRTVYPGHSKPFAWKQFIERQ